MPQPRSGIPNNILQPLTRFRIPLCVKILAANQIRKHKCFDARKLAGKRESGGHFTAAVNAVGVAPTNEGLLSVEECDPDGRGLRLAAEDTSHFQHEDRKSTRLNSSHLGIS